MVYIESHKIPNKINYLKSNSLDKQTQEIDYIELLKIMVLIILKINEEFCLRDSKDNN